MDAEPIRSAGPPSRIYAPTPALSATVFCSLSIFCLLVGIGTWLVGSPPPLWVPSRSVWIGTLLMTGLLLSPIWLGLGYPRLAGAKIGFHPRHPTRQNSVRIMVRGG